MILKPRQRQMPPKPVHAEVLTPAQFDAYSISQRWILKAAGFYRCGYCANYSLGPCHHNATPPVSP